VSETGADIPVVVPAGMTPDPGALAQIERCLGTPGVDRVALMADHHVGYAVPIGGVLASATHISPSGVGYDIGCGNKAVLTDLRGSDLQPDLARVMDEIFRTLSFGVGRRNDERVDHPVLGDDRWRTHPLGSSALTLARSQLGTIGGGNHYVDLLVDEQDRVWVGVHFGSRGIGHKTATYFLRQAGARDDMHAAPAMLSIERPLGQDYLAYMDLAGQYAYAGRDWVCDRVVRLLGTRVLDAVHNHHNFAWRETHRGVPLWVVRKGATPCFPGQRGFVGGSMGDIAVIIRGVEHERPELLASTVHGAGRVMSRTQAAGKTRRRKVKGHTVTEVVRAGSVDWPSVQQHLRSRGIELRGAGADEAPECYKPLQAVLDAHAGTFVIEHTLRPVGVAMAGPDVADPYKD
jgi:tRNA-splicing ligase RtcB (3'-phosphate/5'-hydroxy nucleic acid ligase)